METACGGYDLDALSNALNVAAADPMARNILVDFNTPGGTVTGVREAGDLIASVDAKKPVFSFSETQSTSAGTWLMTQARGIYTTASAQVGSIGVYLALLDRSAQLEEAGIKVNAISAGKYKLAGAPFKPLTAEERAMFQERADRLHAQFKSAVLAKRPDVPADAMEGQVFDGEQAAAIGLTDGVVSSLDQLLRLLN
jgi:protease-4